MAPQKDGERSYLAAVAAAVPIAVPISGPRALMMDTTPVLDALSVALESRKSQMVTVAPVGVTIVMRAQPIRLRSATGITSLRSIVFILRR
jgi:fumarate hydratase class II